MEVIILSGFLGSGKTTLLQHLLEQETKAGTNYAVLMNEIGQVSIDGEILGEDVPMEEIVNGCICCTSKAQLEQSLLSLMLDQKPERIYIESSGVAHPMEVYDTCTVPIIAEVLKVKSIITVIDAKQWVTRENMSIAARKFIAEQVKYADQILINKIELITIEEYEKLTNELQELNPFAKKQATMYASMELADIYDRELKERETHEAFHVKNALHISSMTYQFQEPIDRETFSKWIRKLPNTIYRMKGFVRFTDAPEVTNLLQYSYGVEFFSEVPLPLPMDLVLIGEKLEKVTLKAELQGIERAAYEFI